MSGFRGHFQFVSSALHGKLEVLKLLLVECEYDINDQDSCGNSALFDAVIGKHVDCLKLLLEYKV